MTKKNYRLLIFSAILFFVVLNNFYLDQSIHSEGVGIVSVWPKIIFGIDFEKGKFIYSDEIVVSKELGPIKLNFNSFFPYLTAEIFGKDLMISWVFYYTPFVPYILFSFVKDNPAVQKYIILIPFVLIFIAYFISSLKLANLMFQNFFKDKKFPSLLFILFLISSPSLYCLFYQLHHLQASIFFNLFAISIIQRRYFWSGFLGGLTLYSYSPSVFLVVGLYLTQIVKNRDFRKTLLSMLFSFMFLVPYIFHLYVAEKINYKQIYGCTDCIFYNAYTEIYNFFGQKIRTFSLDELGKNIQKDFLPSIPKLFSSFVAGFFGELKKSFSISDLFLIYGITYEHSEFHNLANISIWVFLIIFFVFGFLFFTGTFEFIALIVCGFMYFIFGYIFPTVPKMLYLLLPFFSILFVKLFFELQRFAKDIAFILIFSMIFRMIDIYGITEKYNDYFRTKEVKEVVEFVVDSSMKNIYVFSLPLAFFYYSEGRINPTTIAIYRWTEDQKYKIAEFIAQNVDSLVIQKDFEPIFLKVDSMRKNFEVVFKSESYLVFRRKE
ncbi:MAG: hypothetical protein NZ927_02550 [Candidatus Calescibacterium sp.]|nr:hypothetical protein [Candidatus Calescibacterium sp.]MCX7734445.1 hypothetical protein [bacterium]MDW8087748.1 hypothetical protein [Candidatus Calescibacterium sp.]